MKQKVTALKVIIGVNELIDFTKYNILFLLEFLTAGALWKRNNDWRTNMKKMEYE